MDNAVNLNEKRIIEITCEQINKYKFGCQAIIKKYEMLIEKGKDSEEVKETYKNIIDDYQKEYEYLNKIFWQEVIK